MEKEKESGKKKRAGLKERDKQMITVVVLLIVLFLGYRYATVTMAEKIEKQAKLIEKKEDRLEELQSADARRKEIDKENEQLKKDNDKIFMKYPEHTSLEKVIEYMVALFREHSFGVGNMSYEDKGVFYNFVDSSGKDNASLGTINSTTLTFEYNCTYRTFSKLVNFINYTCPTRLKIENLEMSVDETAGGLVGSVELSVFTGKDTTKYAEPEFNVDIGNNSLFSAY